MRAVAVADGRPIDFDYRLFRVARVNGAKFATAQVTRVDENFLATLGVTLLRGRAITSEDRVTTAQVTVISAPLAERLFPDVEPIGERLTVSLEAGREQDTHDHRRDRGLRDVSADHRTAADPAPAASELAFTDAPSHRARRTGRRATTPRCALESVLRELGVEAQPGVAFPGIVTGLELTEGSLADLVAESVAVAFAGGIVLVLAALGIVGVVGFMVATRQRELALRMALGSTRLRVFRLMLSDTVKLVIPGVAGGLLLAGALIRAMDDVMGTPLSVGPTPLGAMEPVIYMSAAAIAITIALLAGLPAARRATTVQPMLAIRSE